MSGFELIAALVGSLAWPAVVLVVSVLFRRQIAALLTRPFTSLNTGPVEVVRDREVAEVEAELGDPGPPRSPHSDCARATDELAEVARIAPAAAIVQAFALIEAQLRQLLPDAGLHASRGSPVQLARRAVDAGLVRLPAWLGTGRGVPCRSLGARTARLTAHARGAARILRRARSAPSDASPDGVRWTRQQVQPMPAPAAGAR